jgi:hypothetical protein
LVSVKTTASSDFFSLPRSWAFSDRSRRQDLPALRLLVRVSPTLSKSKIPPKFGFARGQVGEQGGEGVDAFGFHDVLLSKAEIKP